MASVKYKIAVKLKPTVARYNYNLGVLLIQLMNNPLSVDYENGCKYINKAKYQGLDIDEKGLITSNGFNYCK